MKKRIYIAEDDQDIAYLLDTILTDEGYQVDLFKDITSLKLGMNKLQPDLLLMDVILPDGNGLDYCRELKFGADTASHPVFVMSAMMPLEKMVGGHGADAFISKPFKIDFVVDTINCYLDGVNLVSV